LLLLALLLHKNFPVQENLLLLLCYPGLCFFWLQTPANVPH
jgi:hypothetical protein